MEDTYVSYLTKEIAATAILYKRNAVAAAATAMVPTHAEQEHQQDAVEAPSRLETLYFGGGTPSLLSLDGLHAVMSAIDAAVGVPPHACQDDQDEATEQQQDYHYHHHHHHQQQPTSTIHPTSEQLHHPHAGIVDTHPSNASNSPTPHHPIVSETTIEIDPGTFTKDKLEAYRKLGINRASVGVQSFTDSLLESSGRSHNAEAAQEALVALREANFENWSIDLMCGLPNQTMEAWHDSVDQAIAVDAPHISLYELTVEPDTKFSSLKYESGTAPLPMEEDAVDMLVSAANKFVAAGYEHYEVCSFAKPGYRGQHNGRYWSGDTYYGYGLGATSFMLGTRFTRPRTIKKYYAFVDGLVAEAEHVQHRAGNIQPASSGSSSSNGSADDDGSDGDGGPPNSSLLFGRTDLVLDAGWAQDLLNESVFLQLRTAEGISLRQIRESFGVAAESALRDAALPFVESGHVKTIAQGIDGDGDTSSEAIQLSWPDGYLLEHSISFALVSAVADVAVDATA